MSNNNNNNNAGNNNNKTKNVANTNTNVKTNNSVRNKEYEKCLLLNTYNRYIDNIFIINTENGMLTYSRFIEFTKIFPDDINILSNADIFFDESIDLCRHMGDDDAYALSRWDLPKGTVESKFLDAHVVKRQSRSQDTWIVKGAAKKGINGSFIFPEKIILICRLVQNVFYFNKIVK